MTQSVPDGPTDPRLSVAAVEEQTTIVTQPGYGQPGWGASPSEPTLDRPVDQPPERQPTGRVYAGGEQSRGAGSPPGADRGRTTIADDVVERIIEKLVTLAVDEADGAQGLYETEGQPVSVQLDSGHVEINISIRVAFGHAVHEVVEQVRSTVVGQTEHQLGLTVDEVNVLVADVTFDQPD